MKTSTKTKSKSAAPAKPPAKKKSKGKEFAGLFGDCDEVWVDALTPVLSEGKAQVEKLMKDAHVVPSEEFVFQALKSLPAKDVRVVVIGQGPYPRPESATGVAMLDAALTSWESPRFGSIVSMRNIVKAAAATQFGFNPKQNIAAVRKLLKEKKVVSPERLFSALLSQGVLLLNASLTASTKEGSMTASQHSKVWEPVLERIVDTIIENRKTVIFCWWGDKAKKVRKMVEKVEKRHTNASVVHLEHYNPAAQGDLFSVSGDVFGDINSALEKMELERINWLPDEETAEQFSHKDQFVRATLDAHAAFMMRMQDAEHLQKQRDPIFLPAALPDSLDVALGEVYVKGLDESIEVAMDFALESDTSLLSLDMLGAIHLYTQPGGFYRALNKSLRSNSESVDDFLPYLRLFVAALDLLPPVKTVLYRGVNENLVAEYRVGDTICWFGVSSTTVDKAVAESFLGLEGHRTLFVLQNVPGVAISHLSALPEESEVIVPPGQHFKVKSVHTSKNKLSTITLEAAPIPRMVRLKRS